MAGQKHDKHQEAAYRRGYHQAASECLRLVQAAIEQQIGTPQVLELLESWEHQLAIWRGALETGRLLDPPPHPGGPRLRLVEREDDEQEDERVDPRLREIIANVRDIPRWRVRLRSTFEELRMTGVPNLMYLGEAMTEIEKAFGISFGPEALERFSRGSVGELQAYLEGEGDEKPWLEPWGVVTVKLEGTTVEIEREIF